MKLEEILTLAVPGTYAVMYGVETLFPAREFPKIAWWSLVGAGFIALMMSISVIAPLLLPVEWLAAHRLVDGTRIRIVGGVVAGFVAVELSVYGYHRACHTSTFMWRA